MMVVLMTIKDCFIGWCGMSVCRCSVMVTLITAAAAHPIDSGEVWKKMKRNSGVHCCIRERHKKTGLVLKFRYYEFAPLSVATVI